MAAFFVSPSVSVNYKITNPGAVPIRVMEECSPDSATEYEFGKTTRSGTKATVELCFLAQTADNGDRLIPYRVDLVAGQWWGGERYSTEVGEYTRRVRKAFSFPQADEAWIDGQWWPQFLKEIGQGAIVAISGLLFLLAFTWATGWVVRGFMGIPRGQDHKQESGEMK